MDRPRAADDFPIIRSRMVELRRERERILAEQKDNSVIAPRLHRRETGDIAQQSDRLLPRPVVR
jgi:hypothetical protein